MVMCFPRNPVYYNHGNVLTLIVASSDWDEHTGYTKVEIEEGTPGFDNNALYVPVDSPYKFHWALNEEIKRILEGQG